MGKPHVFKPTKIQRVIIYRRLLARLKYEKKYRKETVGMCAIIAIVCVKDFNTAIKGLFIDMTQFSEFWNNRPDQTFKNIPLRGKTVSTRIQGSFWWDDHDIDIRIKYANRILTKAQL